VGNRAARWYIFKPKIQIWVHFGGPWNGECWYILWSFGMIHGHSVHFVVIWYVFPGFGILCEEKSGNPGGCPVWQDLLFWRVEKSQNNPFFVVGKSQSHACVWIQWPPLDGNRGENGTKKIDRI
jgi:hypothetical protein